MTQNTREVEEYNYPSIEHNGEQWIRTVDHIALTNLELQKAREEGERAVWERIKREANRDETGLYMFYLPDHSELDQDKV